MILNLQTILRSGAFRSQNTFRVKLNKSCLQRGSETLDIHYRRHSISTNSCRCFMKMRKDALCTPVKMSLFQRIHNGIDYNIYRQFQLSAVSYHGEYEWEDPKSEDDIVIITVYEKDGTPNQVKGKVGDNLLYLCKRFEVPMEGACEASLACTTCHVYVDEEFQDLLSPNTEKEDDLLDIAPFLKENSRLGCQIILTKELRGLKISLPAATRNFYVDGHKPSH